MLGLPRTYWYLWVGALVNRLGGFVFPFLALYLVEARGYTAARAGLMVSLYGLGSMLAAPVGGDLADRIGRRATLLFAMVFGAAAMLELGLARAGWHVALATLLVGFTSALYRPAIQAAVADLVPPEGRTRAYGYLYWAVNLGFSGAMVLAGVLSSLGFFALFVGDAATSLGFALILFLRVPETRPAPEAGSTVGPMRAPFSDGVFLAFVAVQLLVAVVFQQGSVALPLDLGQHGISKRAFGELIALNGILIVLLQPTAVRLVTRFRRSRVLAWGALLTGLGYGLDALAHTRLGYALSIAVWTFGEMAFSSVAPAVVADLSPPEARGSYQGVYQMAFGASSFLAPALGGLVLGRLGGTILWTGCLLTGALAAALHLALAPARRRRMAALAATG